MGGVEVEVEVGWQGWIEMEDKTDKDEILSPLVLLLSNRHT